MAEGCRIYVTRPIPRAARERLCDACSGVEVNPDDRGLTSDELARNLRGRDGALTFLTDKIGADLIERARELRVIANCAVGLDNIELHAATARGIIVTNTPDVLTEATADLAWALRPSQDSLQRRVNPPEAGKPRLGAWPALGAEFTPSAACPERLGRCATAVAAPTRRGLATCRMGRGARNDTGGTRGLVGNSQSSTNRSGAKKEL